MSTPLTAARLRSICTAPPVLALSEVVLCDERGRRYELVRPLTTSASEVDDKTGRLRPTGVPVLTLVLREVVADARTGETP